MESFSYSKDSENGYGAPFDGWTNGWWSVAANPTDVFLQSAQFVAAAQRLQTIVHNITPWVKTICNEVGILAPGNPPAGWDAFGSQRWWWNLEAAQYAYIYASLAEIGVDQIAASQLTGYPGNAPSISMLDWTNGDGTAWWWVVKMFIEVLGSETKTTISTLINGISAGLSIRPLDSAVCVHTPRARAIAEAQVCLTSAPCISMIAQAYNCRCRLIIYTLKVWCYT